MLKVTVFLLLLAEGREGTGQEAVGLGMLSLYSLSIQNLLELKTLKGLNT